MNVMNSDIKGASVTAEAADNVAVAAEAAAYRVGTVATDAKGPTATADDVAGAAPKAATTIQKTVEAAA